jgi:hypothetical protein
MLFFLALRRPLAMDIPNLGSQARTQHQWSFCLSVLCPRRDDSRGSLLQVGIIIGQVIGRFANDAIMRVSTRRNHGVFEAESRLW